MTMMMVVDAQLFSTLPICVVPIFKFSESFVNCGYGCTMDRQHC